MKALLYLVENKSSDVFYKQVFMLNNLRYSLGVHRIEQGRVNVSSIIVIQLVAIETLKTLKWKELDFKYLLYSLK